MTLWSLVLVLGMAAFATGMIAMEPHEDRKTWIISCSCFTLAAIAISVYKYWWA